VPRPARIFSSYSSADEAFRQELERHLAVLKRAGLIETWNFRQIEAGDEWKRTIDAKLNDASIILLLVSASFLASDYCWEVEMKRALERHGRGEAIVIPIILRDCDWHAAPFAKLQALPESGKAVSRWRPRDRAWSNVVAGIRSRVESLPAAEPLTPAEPAVTHSALLAATPVRHIASAHAVSKEPGPWFHLVSASESNAGLDFAVVNEGAPVVVLDFKAITPGYQVRQWHPSTFPPKETFRAPTTIDPNAQGVVVYEMQVRDRAGNQRAYRLELQRKVFPARLDFQEITR
jgi:TIR domain